jgi:poly(A) polymerase
MSHESVVPVADPARAIHALERAVVCAERGEADRPVVLLNPGDIAALGPSDIRPHLDRVMMGEFAGDGLDSLLVTGALDALLPEIKALVGFGDGEWRHKDVWKHTKQVVTQSVQRIEVRY